MEYYDEQILEARWEEERRKHTTLETGIYVDDDLITFSQITLPDTKIRLYLPEQFGFKGYALDGQNYNRMYIIRMRKTVLHGIFNCPPRVKDQWEGIVEQCFQSVEELWDIL